MNEDSRPRARTVFDAVREKNKVAAEEPDGSPVAGYAPLRFSLTNANLTRKFIVGAAASRELDRLAALIGVLGTHLWTGATAWPVLIVSVKLITAALILGGGLPIEFTWLQAILWSGSLWVVGPLGFFLYRYWSGKF